MAWMYLCYMNMNKKSAGILMYRLNQPGTQVLLVHPGGPYWQNKDTGVWSIPKGEFDDNEQALDAANSREFKEETGITPSGKFEELAPVKLKSGKTIYAWALQGNANTEHITSNRILIEWPPKSGKQIEIPEVDKASWFAMDIAKEKINAGQVPLLEQLEKMLQRR